MARKRTVRDIEVDGKTVLLRADFNVTFVPNTTTISDDSRIQATLPTIEYLLSRNTRIILCSHLGRPKGKVTSELRMLPVSDRLAKLLGRPVVQASEPTGRDVRHTIDTMSPGDIVMLENLRFSPGEEGNDTAFARELASLADVYVNDAFGVAHRAHASTEGVTHFLPSVAGHLMDRELEMLGTVLDSPKHPLVVIIGGAKVSDKLPVIERFTGRASTLLIGGGMAATFLKARGLEVGDSLIENDLVGRAGEIIDSGETTVMLLSDVVLSTEFTANASTRIANVEEIEPGWRIMDIGPATAERYANALVDAGTVLWNGTMGVFEWEPFSEGTRRLAEALAAQEGTISVIGGGSTADAVTRLGLADQMTHVSTGGGASLEFLEGRELPGVLGLMDAE